MAVAEDDGVVWVSIPGEAQRAWVALAPSEVPGKQLGDVVDPARDTEGLFDGTGDVPVFGWLITAADLVLLPKRMRQRRRERRVVADPARAAARSAARAPARAALVEDLRRLLPQQLEADPFALFDGG